jgi:peroxin-6
MTPQYYLAELATEQEIEVLVSQSDFEEALRELVPSVSQEEMTHYAEVQQRFANDTINSASQEGERAGELLVAEVELGTKTNKGKGRAIP